MITDERIGPINDILFQKADELALSVYQCTKSFPKCELFGLTSQLRRAVLSVPLNVTEGFARFGTKDHHRFLEFAYGSLKETKYLLHFSLEQKYIDQLIYEQLMQLADETGRLVWKKLSNLTKTE